MLMQISAVWAPRKPWWYTMIHNSPRPTWRIMKSLPWTPRSWSTGDPWSWQTFPLSATCEVQSLGKWLHPLTDHLHPDNRSEPAIIWTFVGRKPVPALLSGRFLDNLANFCWVSAAGRNSGFLHIDCSTTDQTVWEVTWITSFTWYARKKVFHRLSKPIFVSHIKKVWDLWGICHWKQMNALIKVCKDHCYLSSKPVCIASAIIIALPCHGPWNWKTDRSSKLLAACFSRLESICAWNWMDSQRILEISVYWKVWNRCRLMFFAFALDISEQDACQVLPGGTCLIMETQLLSGRVWEEERAGCIGRVQGLTRNMAFMTDSEAPNSRLVSMCSVRVVQACVQNLELWAFDKASGPQVVWRDRGQIISFYIQFAEQFGTFFKQLRQNMQFQF